MYGAYKPYVSDDDDRLAILAQVPLFWVDLLT